MPIYEYICRTCGKECEVLQKMSDTPGACPHCGKKTLKKRVSASGFRLAGGGWYETDFKTGDKRNLAASGSSDNGAESGAKKTKEDKGSKISDGGKKQSVKKQGEAKQSSAKSGAAKVVSASSGSD